MEQRKEEVKFLFTAALCFILIGIFSYGLIFHVIAPYLFGEESFDKGALSTMIGWSATLFIGYAGYILLDKWKEQENKKIIRDEIIFSSKKAFVMMEQLMLVSYIKKGTFEDANLESLKSLYYELFSSLNLVQRLTGDMVIGEIKDTVQAQFSAFLTLRGEYEGDSILYDVYKEQTRLIAKNFVVLHNKLSDKITIQ